MADRQELLPEQVNEHGQVVDENLLKRNRTLYTTASILFQGVPGGQGMGVATKILKLLGATDVHLGIMGGAVGGLGSIFQFLGALVLRRTKSDRKALRIVLACSMILGVVGLVVNLLYYTPVPRKMLLYAALSLVFLGTIIAAALGNVESNWVGDLVPRNRLGWFVSMKWVGVGLASVLAGLSLAKIGDAVPTMAGYVLIGAISLCFVFGGFLVFARMTDRTPKELNFFSAGATHHERINYFSPALWCYIAFYVIWGGGRAITFSFSTIFLFEELHFSLMKLAWLSSLQFVGSAVVVYLLGPVADKRGNRVILIVFSLALALCMYLWVSAAWFGVAPIIVYTIINSMGGSTHGMLGNNLGLEIFPDKGRAAYLAFSRFFIGASCFVTPIVAGLFLRFFSKVQITLFGVTLTKYYLVFLAGGTVTLCCVIPLVLLGNRKVENGAVNGRTESAGA